MKKTRLVLLSLLVFVGFIGCTVADGPLQEPATSDQTGPEMMNFLLNGGQINATDEPQEGPACQAFYGCLDGCNPPEPSEPPSKENTCSWEMIEEAFNCLGAVAKDDRDGIRACLVPLAECSGLDLDYLTDSILCWNSCEQFQEPCTLEQQAAEEKEQEEQEAKEQACHDAEAVCYEECNSQFDMSDWGTCQAEEFWNFVDCYDDKYWEVGTHNGADGYMECFAIIQECSGIAPETFKANTECGFGCLHEVRRCLYGDDIDDLP